MGLEPSRKIDGSISATSLLGSDLVQAKLEKILYYILETLFSQRSNKLLYRPHGLRHFVFEIAKPIYFNQLLMKNEAIAL